MEHPIRGTDKVWVPAPSYASKYEVSSHGDFRRAVFDDTSTLEAWLVPPLKSPSVMLSVDKSVHFSGVKLFLVGDVMRDAFPGQADAWYAARSRAIPETSKIRTKAEVFAIRAGDDYPPGYGRTPGDVRAIRERQTWAWLV